MGLDQLTKTSSYYLTFPKKEWDIPFTKNQELLLTPVVYSPQDFEYLRKIYRISVQKVGFFYTPSLFRFSFAGKVKSYSFFVASAYHFQEWKNMLFANHQIVLDLSKIDPHPKLYEFAAKKVKFFKKPLEKGCFELVKTRVGDTIYGWSMEEPFYSREPK